MGLWWGLVWMVVLVDPHGQNPNICMCVCMFVHPLLILRRVVVTYVFLHLTHGYVCHHTWTHAHVRCSHVKDKQRCSQLLLNCTPAPCSLRVECLGTLCVATVLEYVSACF